MTSQPEPRLHLLVVARSEVGLVRKNNQDSGYASPRLLVVADGMGGAAAGDLASAVAIDEIQALDAPELLTDAPPDAPSASPPARSPADEATEDTAPILDPATAPGSAGVGEHGTAEQGAGGLNPLLVRFAAAIEEANTRIADLVAADYALEGMGTTVTGALFDGHRLALAHIGDSRAYLLRDGQLEQLTHDHSWVQSLVDDGKITPAEAAYHPHRSLLLKVLNGQPANDPDLTTLELRAGDRLLFCSDGLSGMVDDDEIAQLAGGPDLDAAVAALVDAALAAGGIDNITVLLAQAVAGEDDPDDTAVRAAIAGSLLLGAATERAIPAVPRRTGPVPGFADDEDDTPHSVAAVTADTGPGSPTPRSADDESRYSPQAPVQRRLIRTLVVALALLLVTGAGLAAGYAWTRTQYFVGADNGQVAIFTGLPDGIPGLSLSQVYEVQELPVDTLPPYYQAQVTAGIEVVSLEAARATVAELQAAAARCAPPPTPSPTPKATPTPKASDSASPTTPSPTTPSPSTSTTVIGPTVPPSSAAPTPTPTPSTPQGC